MLELAHTLDAVPQTSPLAEARERRDLSIKQVAYRSGLTEAEIEWLEEGRHLPLPLAERRDARRRRLRDRARDRPLRGAPARGAAGRPGRSASTRAPG